VDSPAGNIQRPQSQTSLGSKSDCCCCQDAGPPPPASDWEKRKEGGMEGQREMKEKREVERMCFIFINQIYKCCNSCRKTRKWKGIPNNKSTTSFLERLTQIQILHLPYSL
jgi:hypothetical protein